MITLAAVTFDGWDSWAFAVAPYTLAVLKAMLVVTVGYIAISTFSRILDRNAGHHLTISQVMIFKKVFFFVALFVVITSVAQNLGFKITTLLGAAGVIGAALAFASQTSVSNIISGTFLVFERPFTIGDFISIGGTAGTVLSIDLISVKMLLPDNRYVRIPNETVLKEQVTNFTRFPQRRIDVLVGVAYESDPNHVIEVLLDIAMRHPRSLKEPKPVVLFQGFGQSSMDFVLGVYAPTAVFLDVKNDILCAVKHRFDAEKIEIPFPQVVNRVRNHVEGPNKPLFPRRDSANSQHDAEPSSNTENS